MATSLYYTYHSSPIGDLLLAGDDDALHFLSFPSGSKAFQPWPEWVRNDAPFAEVKRQLDAYIGGRLKTFDLPLHLGGTEFQRKVWLALADIPFGETRTYGWQATVIGAPLSAARAVGAANGANPVAIILPCHRVIGSTGALTGFGGGLPTKKFLLQLENALPETAETRQLSLL
jgi:methylated-DNA-[protein]-cysteine S-methyltransferase